MKIKTLNLIAFGKFHNRTIEIADGFNLIFGGNEAGKSTIQHFIEGMLFGFFKPYRKKRTYNNDFYRFKPRQGSDYCGTMVIEDEDGRDIRIERDFLKTKDGVRIYDNVTGEDITQTYPYDNVTKQYMPLGYGGFNSVMYNNTVNVKQMASQSDAELAKEVNDRLVDMATDTDDELSVTKVLNYLDKKKEVVGTTGKSKSQYGMAVRELNSLQGILRESEEVYEQIRKNQKRIQQYKRKIEQAQSKCDEYNREHRERTLLDQQEMQKKLRAIKEEGRDIQARLNQIEKFANLDKRVYGQLQVLENSLKNTTERLNKLIYQIDKLKQQKDEIDGRRRRFEEGFKGFTQDEIEQDYSDYCNALTEGNNLRSDHITHIKTKKITDTSSDWVDIEAIGRKPLLIGIILGALLFLFATINPGSILAFIPQIILNFIGLFALVGSVAIMVIANRNDYVLSEHEAKIQDDDISIEEPSDNLKSNDIDNEESEIHEESEMHEAINMQDASVLQEETYSEIDEDEISTFGEEVEWAEPEDYDDSAVPSIAEDILKKYRKKDNQSYEAFIRRSRESYKRYTVLTQESQRIGIHLEELTKEHDSSILERDGFKQSISTALEEAGMESITAYGEGCELGGEAEKLRIRLDANQRLYDELAHKEFVPRENDDEDPVVMTGNNGEEIRVRQAVEAFNHEVARIQGENTSLMSGVGNPVEIRERIETLEGEIEAYELELRACDMAENFFKSYSRQTHYDKAPNLNKKIGAILEGITHKYKEVRVDDQLQIRVIDPIDSSLLSMTQLSGGTVDQIYLALRFGVADMIDQQKTMPIILDDPFVQYDDQRKAEALHYIVSLTNKTQVLLFTCTIDEKRIMDENDYAYVGIGI